MRSAPMRRLPLAAAFAVALTLIVVAAASAASVKPVVFTDPTGDSGTAADITTITVTNDATNFYTFDIAFATPLPGTGFVDLYLDSDLNPATGDPQSDGADYDIELDAANNTFGFYKWDGTQWAFVQTSTVKVAMNPNREDVTFGVGSTDLGTTKGVNFFVFSGDGDGSAGHFDDAPSGSGTFQYMLQVPLAVKLTLAGATDTAPKGGGSWGLVLAAKRSDTGALLGGEGTIKCTASSGSTKLPLAEHAFVSSGGSNGSVAVCGFKVSKKLKGKLVHGTITVSYQGSSVSKSFTAKVK